MSHYKAAETGDEGGSESDETDTSRYTEQIGARVPEGVPEEIERVAFEKSEPGNLWYKADVVREALDEYMDDTEVRRGVEES